MVAHRASYHNQRLQIENMLVNLQCLSGKSVSTLLSQRHTFCSFNFVSCQPENYLESANYRIFLVFVLRNNPIICILSTSMSFNNIHSPVLESLNVVQDSNFGVGD